MSEKLLAIAHTAGAAVVMVLALVAIVVATLFGIGLILEAAGRAALNFVAVKKVIFYWHNRAAFEEWERWIEQLPRYPRFERKIQAIYRKMNEADKRNSAKAEASRE